MSDFVRVVELLELNSSNRWTCLRIGYMLNVGWAAVLQMPPPIRNELIVLLEGQ